MTIVPAVARMTRVDPSQMLQYLPTHWTHVSSAAVGEGARLYIESLRGTRSISQPRDPERLGNLGLDTTGIVSWRRPTFWEARRLGRFEPMLSRWREASHLGGPALSINEAIESPDERAANLAAAFELLRAAHWRAQRHAGARRLDWAMELLLDMLRSAADLAMHAPLDQAVQACEMEILTWRALRTWAFHHKASTELLQRAATECQQLAERAPQPATWFQNEAAVRHQTRQRAQSGMPEWESTVLAAASAAAEHPPGSRSDESAAIAELEKTADPDCQQAIRRFRRAQQVFDQRATAVAATRAFFMMRVYQSRLGHYPTELASAFGGAKAESGESPPQDPFAPDGAAIRMRRGGSEKLRGAAVDTVTQRAKIRPGQPLIYSVADNGVDDDAATVWDGGEGGGDWIFPLPPPPKVRHWRQFDMQKAMILVTLFSLAFGVSISSPQRQARAVRAIRKQGGSLTFNTTKLGPVRRKLCKWFGNDRFGIVSAMEVGEETVTDKTLASIAEFRDLTELAIPGCEIGAPGLNALGRLEQLVTLDISNGVFSDQASFAALSRLAKLESLDVEESNFDQVGMRNLGPLPRLKELDVNNTQVSGEGFKDFARRFPKIERLSIYTCPLQSIAIPEIGKAGTLLHLDLDGSKIKDEDLKHLSGLTKLTLLDIQRTSLTDDALPHLAPLTSLVEVRLNSTNVKGAGLAHLVALPKLADLDLEGTPLTREAARHLLKMKKMDLELQDSGLSLADAKRLRNAGHQVDFDFDQESLGELMMQALFEWLQQGNPAEAIPYPFLKDEQADAIGESTEPPPPPMPQPRSP